MTVTELIDKLLTMPKDADCGYAWEGEVRSTVRYVWLSKDGEVVISDGNIIYSDKSRPKGAPDGRSPYWKPKDTFGEIDE